MEKDNESKMDNERDPGFGTYSSGIRTSWHLYRRRAATAAL
jgi:hypothetical protein